MFIRDIAKELNIPVEQLLIMLRYKNVISLRDGKWILSERFSDMGSIENNHQTYTRESADKIKALWNSIPTDIRELFGKEMDLSHPESSNVFSAAMDVLSNK
ncbi:hypothetical protein [Endozoicomonas sp. ALB032]|uniref:hypothetical protein n=1 Tax=Endozoicomonas sp. ALB032 TaxID=3403082 RepID=UPI003BB5C22A